MFGVWRRSRRPALFQARFSSSPESCRAIHDMPHSNTFKCLCASCPFPNLKDSDSRNPRSDLSLSFSLLCRALLCSTTCSLAVSRNVSALSSAPARFVIQSVSILAFAAFDVDESLGPPNLRPCTYRAACDPLHRTVSDLGSEFDPLFLCMGGLTLGDPAKQPLSRKCINLRPT